MKKLNSGCYMQEWTRYFGLVKSDCWLFYTGGCSVQCKYYQILLGQTCEWSIWGVGCFIEMVVRAG